MMQKGIVDRLFIQETIKSLNLFHDKIIDHSGGLRGTRDEGGLYNSITKILIYQEKHSEDPSLVGTYVYIK